MKTISQFLFNRSGVLMDSNGNLYLKDLPKI